MKMKKIKKTNTMKIVLGLSGIIFVILVAVTLSSRAKYRVTESIQIVNGTVTYKPADLALVSLNVEETAGTGNYIKTKVPPTGNYNINTTRSYCTVGNNGTQLKTIPIEYKDGKLYIGINDTNTKCYVWLDISSPAEDVVDKLGITVNSVSDGCPAYEEAPSITSIEDRKSLLCKGIDDFGDTYYFRGNPTNNWVKIGKFYWRIIRINGNGSIRLILSGYNEAKTTGTGTQLGSTSAYNNLADSSQYVKYDNSTIKGVLDNWYNTNLKSTYGSIMDGNVGFCNDADNGSTSGSYQFFKPYDRIATNKKPTFKCGTPITNLYTTSGGTKGNQKLANPIGLITVDEASFAGGIYSTANSGYYLNNGQDYWTMSPTDFYGSSTAVGFLVNDTGLLGNNHVNITRGVRPVINLKADTQFKPGGDGSSTNPYEVAI